MVKFVIIFDFLYLLIIMAGDKIIEYIKDYIKNNQHSKNKSLQVLFKQVKKDTYYNNSFDNFVGLLNFYNFEIEDNKLVINTNKVKPTKHNNDTINEEDDYYSKLRNELIRTNGKISFD